jgi:hypothetical protein
MKNTFVSLAALALTLASTGVLAAVGDFPTADSDRNGYVSWAEFNLLYPDVTEEEFKAADADADGQLSLDEYDAMAVTTGSVGTAPPLIDEAQPIPESITGINELE